MTGHVSIGGAWKDLAGASVKVSGAWKTVDKGFTKVGGVWKEWYSSAQPAYDLIQTQIVSTSASSVTFSSIPQTYKHLELRLSVRSTRNSGDDPMAIFINNNVSNICDGEFTEVTATSINTSNSQNVPRWTASYMPAAYTNSRTYSNDVFTIFNYASSSVYKSSLRQGGFFDAQSNNKAVVFDYNIIRSNSAITSLKFDFSLSGSSIAGGSVFSLYGIKG